MLSQYSQRIRTNVNSHLPELHNKTADVLRAVDIEKENWERRVNI